MESQLKIVGVTDEVSSCDCCGREGLRRTVALERDGAVVFFGTTCAAVALRRDAADVKREARAAQSKKDAAAAAARDAEARAQFLAWESHLQAAVAMPGRTVAEIVAALGWTAVAPIRAAFLAR